jgi:hypothetical protein
LADRLGNLRIINYASFSSISRQRNSLTQEYENIRLWELPHFDTITILELEGEYDNIRQAWLRYHREE